MTERDQSAGSGRGRLFKRRGWIPLALGIGCLAGLTLLLGQEGQEVEAEEELEVEAEEETASERAVITDDYLGRLEWRGIMALPGDIQFSLHDKETREAFWVGLNEVIRGVEVVEYDRDRTEIIVQYGAATRNLSLAGAAVATAREESAPPEPPPPVTPDEPADEPDDPTDEPDEPADEPDDPTDEPDEPADEPDDPTDDEREDDQEALDQGMDEGEEETEEEAGVGQWRRVAE